MQRSFRLKDPLAELRRFTPARIALGRAGSGLPTSELLAFGLAHARARDAVHAALDPGKLALELLKLNLSPQVVRSAASDRATYLRRPDLGRKLGGGFSLQKSSSPIAIVLADGLSSIALQRHAVPLVRALLALAPQRWADASVAIALQGRVALGDDIGERLGAQLVSG